MSCTKSD